MKLRRAASKSFEDNGNGGSVDNNGEQEVERSRLKDENVQQACSELMQVRPLCDMCRDNFELNRFNCSCFHILILCVCFLQDRPPEQRGHPQGAEEEQGARRHFGHQEDDGLHGRRLAFSRGRFLPLQSRMIALNSFKTY